jgi:hypothetical protein
MKAFRNSADCKANVTFRNSKIELTKLNSYLAGGRIVLKGMVLGELIGLTSQLYRRDRTRTGLTVHIGCVFVPHAAKARCDPLPSAPMRS